MAAAGQDVRGRSSSDFVDDTILEAFVPAASEVNVQELLESWDGEMLEDKNTIVPFIEQRQFLLLDEEVSVHVVLRTKLLDENVLEAYLARLAISLEARAYGTLYSKPGENDKPLPANELLYSGPVDNVEEPTICATEVQVEGKDEAAQYVYIFWKTSITITRPKSKINKLSIFFAPSAALKPVEAAKPDVLEDEYMSSGIPQPPNLLSAFVNEPSLNGVKPRLLAPQVRTAPSLPAVKELQRSLRSGLRRLFRAAPAFLWRLRFMRSPAATDHNVTIAALDLEITPFANSDVLMEQVDLSMSSGKVEPLCSCLPLRCHSGDQVTLLFKLHPEQQSEIADTTHFDLKVSAAGTVLVSEACIPKIKFSWTTPVELPSARLPSRPGGHAAPKPLGPDSLPMADQPSAHEVSHVRNGLVLSITGPPSVAVGESFTWELFVVNRSEEVHKLAVVPVPKRRPWAKHGQKDSSTSIRPPTARMLKDTLAESVIDERFLYSEQRNAVQEATGLICESPDVRIGPLAPGACFTTELKFVALAKGVLTLDALKIVDLGTGDAVDIRELPDIVVSGGSSSSDSE